MKESSMISTINGVAVPSRPGKYMLRFFYYHLPPIKWVEMFMAIQLLGPNQPFCSVEFKTNLIPEDFVKLIALLEDLDANMSRDKNPREYFIGPVRLVIVGEPHLFCVMFINSQDIQTTAAFTISLTREEAIKVAESMRDFWSKVSDSEKYMGDGV